MPSINFSQEWDKLKPEYFKKDKEFTSFRAYKPFIQEYYEKNRNQVFDIKLKKTKIGEAELIDIIYIWSNQLGLVDIKEDTRQDYTFKKWRNLMKNFYGVEKVFGLYLCFKITEAL